MHIVDVGHEPFKVFLPFSKQNILTLVWRESNYHHFFGFGYQFVKKNYTLGHCAFFK